VADDTFRGNVELFAYSSYHINDLDRSLKPAAHYSLLVTNPETTPMVARFMFNLPLRVEENTARTASDATAVSATDAIACMGACDGSASCQSWTFTPRGDCMIATHVPLNAYADNSTSGIRSVWRVEERSDVLCLVLDNQVLDGPTLGNASVCTPVAEGATVAYAIGNTAGEQWSDFTAAPLSNSSDLQGAYGALAVEMVVPAGGAMALPLTLSWYYPQRDYLGNNIGNYYSQHWDDSVQVAQASFQDEADNLNNITTLHQAFFNSSLPAWLQDSLINTLSHVRSAWMTADGRWRQWEAYDCVNIDSVHNDGERHLPYIFFFPETTRIKMAAWAKTAQPDGMIVEQLGNGCTGKVPELDQAAGRRMSDVSSMLIV
jgi:non-lysosomal glucosylceramidase